MTEQVSKWVQRGAKQIPMLPIKSQGAIKITRQANRTLLSCIACTAVLNRVGEIDSRQLFDSFILRQKVSGDMPDLLFYHVQDIPALKLGKVIRTLRDGYNYIAIAEIDPKNRLAQMFASSIELEPDYWGISIGYRPEGKPELLRTKNGVVEVFNDGFNHEISLLPEAHAASYFTKVGLY